MRAIDEADRRAYDQIHEKITQMIEFRFAENTLYVCSGPSNDPCLDYEPRLIGWERLADHPSHD